MNDLNINSIAVMDYDICCLKENQFSQGELILPNKYIELEISPFKIQRCDVLPEFVKKPNMPLILTDKNGVMLCCDGWEIISRAIENNSSSVICKVLYQEIISEEDIALNKLKARIRPLLGSISYVEQVRGISMYCRKFNFNLVNQKGGDRKSSSFAQSESKAKRLAEELDIAYSTLCGWHHSGLFLNEEALEVAVQCEFTKEHFKFFNQIKDRFYLDLKGNGREHLAEEIISRAFIKAFKDIPANNLKDQDIKKIFSDAILLEEKRIGVLTAKEKKELINVWEGFEKEEEKNDAVQKTIVASLNNISTITVGLVKKFSFDAVLDTINKIKVEIEIIETLLKERSNGYFS